MLKNLLMNLNISSSLLLNAWDLTRMGIVTTNKPLGEYEDQVFLSPGCRLKLQ